MNTKPRRLDNADVVRLVSPASTPERNDVEATAGFLESIGLNVEIGKHVFDRHGYLAGPDDDRLADFNDALRDPSVKAIIATRGGKGAYRIADKLDFAAARANPKFLIGFSEITVLHLALYKHCQLSGIHGAPWDDTFGEQSAESFRKAAFTSDRIGIGSDPNEPGVAIGQYTQCGPDATTQGSWTAIDVLSDRLHRLGVPVLGALRLGHGEHPLAVPVGTSAVLDADAGTLVVDSAVA